MVQRDGHQSVDRRLVECEREKFDHPPGGLNEALVAWLKLERAFVMELRPSSFKRSPTPLIVWCDALQPVDHQTALQQGGVKDADMLVSLRRMMAFFEFNGVGACTEDDRLVRHRWRDANEAARGVRIGYATQPQRQPVHTTPASRSPLPSSGDARPCLVHDGFDFCPLRNGQAGREVEQNRRPRFGRGKVRRPRGQHTVQRRLHFLERMRPTVSWPCRVEMEERHGGPRLIQ